MNRKIFIIYVVFALTSSCKNHPSNKIDEKDKEKLVNQLKELEENFDAEIKMRKEKLRKLDEEYTKEIKFFQQAQSKGQIDGEDFQKRFRDVQTEYKTKKNIENTQLTKVEGAKEKLKENYLKIILNLDLHLYQALFSEFKDEFKFIN
ncbi:hypothetical protein [Borreliella bavariensis]|uniref:hypothetical protein n=1 Tax=Borreliella bavariensis TaxID=664662 RepID=UPI001F3A6C01|nr:hypothetical protein [Borreliella bavariensis]